MLDREAVDRRINNGLGFLELLRTSENKHKFWETLDPKIDHKVWPQSQYLMYVLFTVLGNASEASGVKANNDFLEPAGDREGLALDRFCIIIEDKDSYALNRISNQANRYSEDCISLLGLYCQEREKEKLWPIKNLRYRLPSSEKCVTQLAGYYDNELGFFSNQSKPAELYKLSLFAIFAAKAFNQEWCRKLTDRLMETQSDNGGWKTHWIGRMTPNPVGTVENLETTALSLMALSLSLRLLERETKASSRT